MYYSTSDITRFFDKNEIGDKAPPSFWQKAIPAARELGFGLGEFTDDHICVITPSGKKIYYKGFKEQTSATTLGIVFSHAILSTQLH